MFLFCFLHIVFSNHIHLFPCLFSDAEEEEQGKEEVEKKERKYKHNPKVLNQRKGIYSCYYQLLKYSLLNVSLFYSEEDDVPEENVEVDWEEETQKRNPRRGTQEEEPKKRNPRRGTKKRNPRRGTQEEEEEEPKKRKKRSQQKRFEKWIQKKRNHQKRSKKRNEKRIIKQTVSLQLHLWRDESDLFIYCLQMEKKDRLRIGTWRGIFRSRKKISMKQRVHSQMVLYARRQELLIHLICLMTFTYSSFCFQIERRHRRELWCSWRSRGKHSTGTNSIDEE